MELSEVIRSKRGVRFQCIACGYCCSGESEGLVFLYKQEIQAICSYLKISEADFLLTYCDVVDVSYKDGYMPTIVLQMSPATQNCIFQQKDNTCRIYPVRPFQCEGFPFWALNLRNPTAWEKVKAKCPGFAAKEGARVFTLDEIKALLDKERQLEEDHYNLLKQNDFKLSLIYRCLRQKEIESNVTKSLDRHPRTVSNHSQAGSTRNSPNNGRD